MSSKSVKPNRDYLVAALGYVASAREALDQYVSSGADASWFKGKMDDLDDLYSRLFDVPDLDDIREHLVDRRDSVDQPHSHPELESGCPSSDRERLSSDCVPNPAGYCSVCGAGRDHS